MRTYKTWHGAALALGSTLATLALGEAAVRIGSAALNRHPITVSDPVAGWANKPNLRKLPVTYGRGDVFKLSTDAHGRRRCYPEASAPKPDAPVLLLVGDSFAEGIGADDGDTLCWLLAQQLPANYVVNLGVAGYGTTQQLAKLEEFLERNAHANVEHIVTLVYDNDFTDVQADIEPFLGRHKPSFSLQGNGQLSRQPFAVPLSDRLMDRSRLFWLVKSKLALAMAPALPRSEGGVPMVVAALAEMKRRAGQRNASWHAFAHHHLKLRAGRMMPEADWRRFLDQSGAVDLTGALQSAGGPTLMGSDGSHWNRAGNAEVARRIAERVDPSASR